MYRLMLAVGLLIGIGFNCPAQNTNSSNTTQRSRRTTNTNQSQPQSQETDTTRPAVSTPAPRRQNRATVSAPQAPGSAAVVAAFNSLLDGIRKADVNAVTAVYWNSPRLILFNNNGTVTKGWEQMRKNRETSYPDLQDVKLDVRDVSVIMLGRDGALVNCLWTQSQIYKGASETATGRMTLVFRRVGTAWKAVHLHTSPDKEDPSRVPPSERTTPPETTPTPP